MSLRFSLHWKVVFFSSQSTVHTLLSSLNIPFISISPNLSTETKKNRNVVGVVIKIKGTRENNLIFWAVYTKILITRN